MKNRSPIPGALPIKVVAGNGNRPLAARVAAELNVKLMNWDIKARSCGEVVVEANEPVRGFDVYVIQPTCASSEVGLNQTVLELLFMIRRLRLEGASRITAVVPFFAYARQDRKTDLRCPISASAVSQLIDKMGVDRVVTLDLHSGQIQGYFNNRAPLDNLGMAHEFAQYVRAQRWFDRQQTVVVSPDAGGVARAHAFADLLGVSHIVTVMKRRAKAGVVSEMQTVGDVQGYTCIIVDDMVDTGGTLVKACELLKNMGSTKVVACITHGVMTDPCVDRINTSDALDTLVVSDSIPQENNLARANPAKFHVLGCAALIAEAMHCYNSGGSLSQLFDRPVTPRPQLQQALSTVSPLSREQDVFPAHPAAAGGPLGASRTASGKPSPSPGSFSASLPASMDGSPHHSRKASELPASAMGKATSSI
jgi:ribose-phosphate pyrophosphokinase